MSFLGGLLGGLGGIAGSLINSWSSNKIADKNNQLSFDLSNMNSKLRLNSLGQEILSNVPVEDFVGTLFSDHLKDLELMFIVIF